MSLHLLKPMIQEGGYGRKKTARKKARRRRSKNMEERDKYYLWGRRRNGLTDNFTLTIYMQFLVAADMQRGGLSRPTRTHIYERQPTTKSEQLRDPVVR